MLHSNLNFLVGNYIEPLPQKHLAYIFRLLREGAIEITLDATNLLYRIWKESFMVIEIRKGEYTSSVNCNRFSLIFIKRLYFCIIPSMSDNTNTEDKNRLISLPDAAEMYGFNPQYLSRLAKKGRLKAQKIGNMWLTTPNDMEEYIKSREKRGAYRDDIQVD